MIELVTASTLRRTESSIQDRLTGLALTYIGQVCILVKHFFFFLLPPTRQAMKQLAMAGVTESEQLMERLRGRAARDLGRLRVSFVRCFSVVLWVVACDGNIDCNTLESGVKKRDVMRTLPERFKIQTWKPVTAESLLHSAHPFSDRTLSHLCRPRLGWEQSSWVTLTSPAAQ